MWEARRAGIAGPSSSRCAGEAVRFGCRAACRAAAAAASGPLRRPVGAPRRAFARLRCARSPHQRCARHLWRTRRGHCPASPPSPAAPASRGRLQIGMDSGARRNDGQTSACAVTKSACTGEEDRHKSPGPGFPAGHCGEPASGGARRRVSLRSTATACAAPPRIRPGRPARWAGPGTRTRMDHATSGARGVTCNGPASAIRRRFETCRVYRSVGSIEAAFFGHAGVRGLRASSQRQNAQPTSMKPAEVAASSSGW